MMIGEVAVKTVETTAKVVAETAKEAGKEAAKKAIDITKRIDVAKAADTGKGGVDITKRLSPEAGVAGKEISKKDVSDLAKEYMDDLKSKSDCPDTLKDKKIDVSKLEKQPSEKVAELREEFNDNRSKLRNEWSKQNNREWPRYDHDVYNENGVKVRNAGDRLDAHHIQPLELGGKNVAENITPLDISKHQEIHSMDGSCKKLVEGVKEVSKA